MVYSVGVCSDAATVCPSETWREITVPSTGEVMIVCARFACAVFTCACWMPIAATPASCCAAWLCAVALARRLARTGADSCAFACAICACEAWACACACVTAVRAASSALCAAISRRLVGVGLALRDVALREQLVVARDRLLRERQRALRLGDVRLRGARSRRSTRSPSPARRARWRRPLAPALAPRRPRRVRRSRSHPTPAPALRVCASDACAWSSAAWNVVGSSFARIWPLRTCELKSASISAIVPETCVPMLIVFCGLSVPLAVTVCASEPVCTGTVSVRHGARARAHGDHGSDDGRDHDDRGGDEPPARAAPRGFEDDGRDVAVRRGRSRVVCMAVPELRAWPPRSAKL